MIKDFIVDIETLDTSSSALLLSTAIIAVDFDAEFDYDELLKVGIIVKFDAKSQPGRTVSQSSLDWWKTKPQELIDSQMKPAAQDVSLAVGIEQLRAYIHANGYDEKKSIFWTRGIMDTMVLEDVAKKLGVPLLYPWWRQRDVRTAIDFLSGSDNGYCKTSKKIPYGREHEPLHDCARDGIMMKYFIEQD